MILGPLTSLVNHRVCLKLEGNKFVPVQWKNIRVGDLLRIERDEAFPADLVLLSSSEPDALCYVETSNLDGYEQLGRRYLILSYQGDESQDPTGTTRDGGYLNTWRGRKHRHHSPYRIAQQ